MFPLDYAPKKCYCVPNPGNKGGLTMKKTIPVPLSILSIPILLAAPYVPLLFLSRWTPEEVYFFQPPPLLFRFLWS